MKSALTDAIREHGPHPYSDADLLALALAITPQRARAALDAAGGLRQLLNDPSMFLPKVSAVRLVAAAEIGRRNAGAGLNRGAPLADPKDTADWLIRRLRDVPHEVFCALFLDTRHRVIAFDEMFRGTIDGASVHPREMVKAAMRHNAAALILAHNHPSGVAEPSDADRLITRRLREALGVIEVRVLDHFVVGDGYAVSFAERGWL